MLRSTLAFIFLFLFLDLSSQEKKQTFADGKLVAEYTWLGNKPKGPYCQWYANGKIQSKGIIDGNTKTGTSWWYYETDTLRKIVEFSSSFSSAGHFADYVLEETVTEFWENGKKKSLTKFRNGKEQYGTTLWFVNGNLKSTTTFDYDQSHRIYTTYFETGERKNERTFLNTPPNTNSIQDGLYREWNENGIQITESTVRNGKQEGIVREWSDDGKLINDSYYENGLQVSQKKWDENGKVIVDFDRRKKDNEIQEVYYYDDKISIRQINYVKKYLLDDSTVTLHFMKQFSLKGDLTFFLVKNDQNPLHHPEALAFWFDVRLGMTLPCIRTELIKDKQRVIGYNGNFLKATREYKSFKIDPVYNPVYDSKPASTYYIALVLPEDFNPAKPDKLLKAKVDELKEKLADPAKVNSQYIITNEQAEKIAPFYKALIPKVYFDSAVVTTNFDSTRTGSFTILFTGTKMKCTGSLKEGLVDGKYTFWLDDATKLDERDYRFGLLHGEVKEWYVNGKPARTASYKFNVKSGAETFYYFSGGKRSEAEYAGDEKPVSEISWYPNGNIQSSCTFYDLPKSKHLEIKDEWYENGKPKKISMFVDSVYKEATLAEDGTVADINIYDAKKNYRIHKYYYNNKLAKQNTLKSEEVTRYDYSFEKNGVKISGIATWDNAAGAWNMEDNMGKAVAVERVVLKFREDLPCNCQEFTEHGYFGSPTKDFISAEDFKKYQLDFHQPLNNLSAIFGDPNNNFGNTNASQRPFVIGKTYSYYAPLAVVGDFSFALPDSTGLIFSLTPCRSQTSIAGFNVNIAFRYGFPKQTEITIHRPKTLSLGFNPAFLRQVNDSGVALKNTKGEYMGALYLFSGNKVTYNAERELDVANPVLQCSNAAEISGTGIYFYFNSFFPDLSRTKNYPQMAVAYDKQTTLFPARFQLDIPLKNINEFRGAYSDNAQVIVPVLTGGNTIPFSFVGTDLLVGGNFITGTLKLNVRSTGNEKYSFVNEKNATVTFTKKELADSLEKCGWTKNIISFDPETSELLVHFYYEK
jgi:antitoxin component YwqK of YwqJK toxin-antitoxin module